MLMLKYKVIIISKFKTLYSTVQLQLHIIIHSMRGYTERVAVPHAMWLRVPWPCPTLSRVSMHGN